MTKGKVGRPPQTDAEGNRIDKTLINLTIPVTLKNFLDKHVKNRSEFFTEQVTKLYMGLICSKCYDDEYHKCEVENTPRLYIKRRKSR